MLQRHLVLVICARIVCRMTILITWHSFFKTLAEFSLALPSAVAGHFDLGLISIRNLHIQELVHQIVSIKLGSGRHSSLPLLKHSLYLLHA